MINTKPCKCGNPKPHHVFCDPGEQPMTVNVRCGHCKAEGPEVPFADSGSEMRAIYKATALWNERTKE